MKILKFIILSFIFVFEVFANISVEFGKDCVWDKDGNPFAEDIKKDTVFNGIIMKDNVPYFLFKYKVGDKKISIISLEAIRWSNSYGSEFEEIVQKDRIRNLTIPELKDVYAKIKLVSLTIPGKVKGHSVEIAEGFRTTYDGPWSAGQRFRWNLKFGKVLVASRNWEGMFKGTGPSDQLIKLDISQWDASGVTSMKEMFEGQMYLRELRLPSNFDTNEATDMTGIFDMSATSHKKLMMRLKIFKKTPFSNRFKEFIKKNYPSFTKITESIKLNPRPNIELIQG